MDIDERIPQPGEGKRQWMRRMDRLDALVKMESKWIKPEPVVPASVFITTFSLIGFCAGLFAGFLKWAG